MAIGSVLEHLRNRRARYNQKVMEANAFFRDFCPSSMGQLFRNGRVRRFAVGEPLDLELTRSRSRVNTWTAWTEAWFKFRGWRERRRALLREEQERALAREEARVRAAFAAAKERPETTIEVVRWGLPADEAAVAELLELNGMPRWVAFEERFIVAEEYGKVLGALRYRTESKRLLLGLLVVDPWGGEERLGRALYAGAGELAGELGGGEGVASGVRGG